MKIIHCADVHLDSKMDTHITKEQAKQRRSELLGTFRRMVEYAAEHGACAVLIAGDLFDTKSVSATARNFVRELIVKHRELAFYYLQGNHDEGSFVSGLSEKPENLFLFENSWTSYVLDRQGKVILSGVELNEENSGEICNSLMLDLAKTNVVMLHGQEAMYAGKDKAELVPLSALKNKGIDYLALGHVHAYKYEKLDGRGIYCYPGCLEGRGFDECGEHGFVELTFDDETGQLTNHTFVPIADRCLYTIKTDISDCMTTSEILSRLEEQTDALKYDKRSLVKYELTGAVDVQCEKDIDLLQQQLASRFYFVRVKDLTSFRVDYDQYEHDLSLKGEFIRTVKQQTDLSEEEKASIIHYGIQALCGEEILEA